jgi:4-azaleucine resistance transporter AzlC
LKPRYRRDAVVLGLAVGVFGVSFGVLAGATGLGVAKTCAMSLLVFTGGSQFAAVGVIQSGGSTGTALGSALLLAARHTAYGITLSPILRSVPLGRRLLGAHIVLDESTAMATAQTNPDDARGAFWITGVAVFVCWNLGTLLGAVAGSSIGDPSTFGLDAAFPAGFIALVAPHLRRRPGQVAAGIGALLALILTPLTQPGVPVIVAALAVLPAAMFAGADDAPVEPDPLP